jgi:hypothetical protein
LSLWIETAHQSLARAGEEMCGDVVRTFQTEDQFFVILVSCPRGTEERRTRATQIADSAADMLTQGTPLETVVETILATLSDGGRMPFSILQVFTGESSGECLAHLAECDAPPLFLTRSGKLVLLPVLEDVSYGRLVRTCRFPLQDGDRLVMVSQGYLRPRGWGWSWSDVAVAVRRWTDTGCDADELMGALVRTYRRLNPGAPRQDVTVVAMHVRPRRTATVWTGPPTDPAQDGAALNKLMVEQDTRVLCGDTTAQIAARLLGAELELEPRPRDGWAEIPPTSRLEGVNLVTEGLVTLGKARERMAGVKRARDRSAEPSSRAQAEGRSRRSLPREENGATRLARALLTADKIHFIVGLAVNPAQAADDAGTVPLRRIAIDDLVRDLKVYGKIISVEYL